MQTERNKGAITVFLAITFIFIMAMLGTLIDGARLVEAHAQTYYATDLAATSALAEFNYTLKDHYGLFAYDGEPDEVIDFVVKQNLNALQNFKLSESEELYQYIYNAVSNAVDAEDISRNKPFDLLALTNVSTSEASPKISLGSKEEFERQIFEYAKFRGPIELLISKMSFDFSELDKELEKAKNEDDVDKALNDLQIRLADHYDKQALHNEKMQCFQKDMMLGKSEFFNPIKEELPNPPSLAGLKTLKGMMSAFSSSLNTNPAVASDCADLTMSLEAIVEERHNIIEVAREMKGQFAGDGDNATFGVKPISGEMKDNYISDLNDIEQKAELKWDRSTTNWQLGKYGSISGTVSGEIQPRIAEYIEEIEVIEALEEELNRLKELKTKNESNDDRDNNNEYDDEIADLEEEIESKVQALWGELSGHFNGALYENDAGPVVSSGIYSNTVTLEQLLPHDTDQSRKNAVKELTQKAKEKSETNDKRKYSKKIPSEYVLPGELTAEDVADALSQNFDGDLIKTNRDEVKNIRLANSQSTQGIKDLFNGVERLTLNTFDNAMLGLYSIANFKNTLCWNKGKPRPADYEHETIDLAHYSLNMRNDTINYSFFDDCQVEYLIAGNRDEQKNYQSIRNELTGLYFTLNYACVRRPKEIRTVVEGIARSVQAAITGVTLGVGAGAGVIAYYATREACYSALAGVQTSHDLERLYMGNKVPLIKKNMLDFCGIGNLAGLSSVSCESKDKSSPTQLPIGYVDYLFVRMVLTDNEQLVGRLQNIVDLDMNNGDVGRSFKLEEMWTSVSVKTEATLPFFFINVMFMAENYDGQGMKITKYASQKY